MTDISPHSPATCVPVHRKTYYNIVHNIQYMCGKLVAPCVSTIYNNKTVFPSGLQLWLPFFASSGLVSLLQLLIESVALT